MMIWIIATLGLGLALGFALGYWVGWKIGDDRVKATEMATLAMCDTINMAHKVSAP